MHLSPDDPVLASLAAPLVVPRGEDGYPYLVHPLLDGVPRVAPALLEHACDTLAAHPLLADATLIVAPEAMAIPLAAGVARRRSIPYTVARKRAYGLPGELHVRASTGYHHADLHLNDIGPNDRVVVIDDVLSTGGTLEGLLGALTPACRLIGALVLVGKGIDPGIVAARHHVRVETVYTVHIEDGHVRVRRSDA